MIGFPLWEMVVVVQVVEKGSMWMLAGSHSFCWLLGQWFRRAFRRRGRGCLRPRPRCLRRMFSLGVDLLVERTSCPLLQENLSLRSLAQPTYVVLQAHLSLRQLLP